MSRNERAVIPTWSYFKLIKWAVSILSASGIIAFIGGLLSLRSALEFCLATVLSISSIGICCFIAYFLAGKLKWWNCWEDRSKPVRSAVLLSCFLLGVSFDVAASASVAPTILEFIFNLINTITSIIHSLIVGQPILMSLLLVIAFFVFILLGAVLICIGLKVNSIECPVLIKSAVENVFQERAIRELIKVTLIMVGVATMLTLPFGAMGMGIVGVIQLSKTASGNENILVSIIFYVLGIVFSCVFGKFVKRRSSMHEN